MHYTKSLAVTIADCRESCSG